MKPAHDHPYGQLLSIQTGKPEQLTHKGKTILTAINKQPRTGAVRLLRGCVEGDAQAEPSAHGGPDKAALLFSADRYSYWQNRLGRPMRPGLFGENLTVAGMTEEEINIGDRLRIGSALLEVTEPRQPCYKLGVWLDQPKLPLWVKETGYGGYYLRVLEEGIAEAGDFVQVEHRHTLQVSVIEAFEVFYDRSENWSKRAKRVLKVEALGQDWKNALQLRLNKNSASSETE